MRAGRASQVPEGAVTAGDHSLNVHVKHCLVSAQRYSFKLPGGENPGVIEQHVKPLAAMCPEIHKRLLPGLGIAHVERTADGVALSQGRGDRGDTL
ncbi:hypothetical protein D3C85_1664010 [compost metagenome]